MQLCLFFGAFVVLTSALPDESFVEELVLTPLPNGKLMAHLEFTIRRNFTTQQVSNFNLFPKSIGQIMSHYKAQEVHLTFTQGRWRSDLWGYPISSAPTGVALLAWFDSAVDVDQTWKGMQRALGGLFCASLNKMDPTITSAPTIAYRPRGDLYSSHTRNVSNSRVRYSVMTRESVCTENLTPFIKQLPCHNRQGLARLLQYPKQLLASQYFSLGVHLQTTCLGAPGTCDSRQSELILRISVVFDSPPKATMLDGFFGVTGGLTSCPLASTSRVYVARVPSRQWNKQKGSSTPVEAPSTGIVKRYDIYALTASPPFHLEIAPLEPYAMEACPVLVNRYVTGDGSTRGGLVTHITNTHKHLHTHVAIYQMIPWYLRLYFHTIKLTINNQPVDTTQVLKGGDGFQLQIGREHQSPSVLEFTAHVPPLSVFSVSVQYDKALLHWTNYPPDPNRGFDIGPATVVLHDNHTKAWQHVPPLLYQPHHPLPVELYTQGQAVMLPLPDFSMPYNVITITCTILALFFGQVVHGLTVAYADIWEGHRTFQPVRPTTQFFRFLMNNQLTNYILDKLGSEGSS